MEMPSPRPCIQGRGSRPALGLRVPRRLTGLLCATLLGWGGIVVDRWLGEEVELLRYRLTMEEVTTLVRAMRTQAVAKGRPLQLRIDASHGTFRMTSVQGGAKAYELLERTVWLPSSLEISDAPETLMALPTGQLSSACIIVSAPTQQKRFRLLTSEQGTIRLSEESTL